VNVTLDNLKRVVELVALARSRVDTTKPNYSAELALFERARAAAWQTAYYWLWSNSEIEDDEIGLAQLDEGMVHVNTLRKMQ
jgi:hypothetical protein